VVLSDARLRREYDARLRRDGAGAPAPRPAREPIAARQPPPAPPLPGWTPVTQPATLELDEPAEPTDGVYDGRALRRIRLSRGIELEEIAAVTKINETYLRYLEEDRYPDLPAPVYVRGFLREYARYLRLDPGRVTESYMTRATAGASR